MEILDFFKIIYLFVEFVLGNKFMCIQSENVKTVENEVDEKKSGFTVQKKTKT